MTKRLYRSVKGKMLGGVSAGLADYFEVDVTLVRLIWLITLAGGFGFIAYLVAWIVIPINPEQVPEGTTRSTGEYSKEVVPLAELDEQERVEHREKRRQLAGALMICVGVLVLFNRVFYWLSWSKLWPVILIAIGILILFRGNIGGKRG